MESGVPVFEMLPNKVQMRAIGQGKDKEQRSWVAQHGNIKNKGGRSKNLQDRMKNSDKLASKKAISGEKHKLVHAE